jgi:hypothetical protein
MNNVTTLKRQPKLRAVDSADIYASWRADIAKRDWNAVHIAADRRGFFTMPEHRKWRYS